MINYPAPLKPTDAELQAIKDQNNGEVFLFERPVAVFVLRAPPALSYRKWYDGARTYDASTTLAAENTLFPPQEQLKTLFDRYAGLPVELAAELGAIAHNSDKAESKKG
jgi:hypothetical protein